MMRPGTRFLCFLLHLFGLPTLLLAQFQIPNGDFESWTTPPLAQYQEPTGGWWTTLNTLKSLGGPVTVEKTTDAHGGTYAAKLTTGQWGSLLIPGLLVSGEFDVQNPSFLIQGKPCVDLPSTFDGWYKFTPANGDSAAIAALLTRWNTSTQRRDTLLLAAYSVTAAQGSWAPFSLPFVTLQSGTPDTILVALVSSGDGQNFNGQVGSTLWVDDISLTYATGTADHLNGNQQVISLSPSFLELQLPPAFVSATCSVSDASGRLLLREPVVAGSASLAHDWASGIYFVEVRDVRGNVIREKLALLRP